MSRINAVICTPFRPRGNRDTHIWTWVQRWIATNYPMPITVGDTAGVFSTAAARNQAAKTAGNWDVALFHDADTIAHPDAVAQAVDMAATSMQMVVTADAHMYCDEPSTERILKSGNPGFARPVSFDKNGIYERPCSGIVAVNRDLFDRVGGFVESLTGWGYEDLVFLISCGIFGDGNTWVPGHINVHLWHPPAAKTLHTRTNRKVWQTLTNYRRRNDPDGARTYLASLGHTVP